MEPSGSPSSTRTASPPLNPEISVSSIFSSHSRPLPHSSSIMARKHELSWSLDPPQVSYSGGAGIRSGRRKAAQSRPPHITDATIKAPWCARSLTGKPHATGHHTASCDGLEPLPGEQPAGQKLDLDGRLQATVKLPRRAFASNRLSLDIGPASSMAFARRVGSHHPPRESRRDTSCRIHKFLYSKHQKSRRSAQFGDSAFPPPQDSQ